MIKSSFTPPMVDHETVKHYIAKGRRERSLAIAEFFRSLFHAQEGRKAPIRRKVGTGATAA